VSTHNGRAGRVDPNYCPKVADWDPAWAAFEDDVIASILSEEAKRRAAANRSPPHAAPMQWPLRRRNIARHGDARSSLTKNPDGARPPPSVEHAADETDGRARIAEGRAPAEVAEKLDGDGHAQHLEPHYGFIGVLRPRRRRPLDANVRDRAQARAKTRLTSYAAHSRP
jgi:hypothetical protein